MAHLVEVAFKGNRKEFFLWDYPDPPPLNAAVIVDVERGEDLGYIHSLGDLAQKRNGGCSHGCGNSLPERKALRLASDRDRNQSKDLDRLNEDTRRKAMERVRANGLGMKLSDAEWQWDRKKLTLYFTADKRVDFRNLVRDLASLFRTRIELKQIGVRDEAKRLDGIGRCGRRYCSASWLPELRPVNLGVAKDQRLSLNPSQISGACGRLMCCLRYEHEFYVASRKKYPKEGKPVRTARGEEKVLANDIFRERVTLRGIDGEVRILPLAALREEMLAAGDALAQTLATAAVAAELAASAPPPELEEDDDELSADEALDTEHSPDHVASIATALDPAMDVTLEWPSPRVDAEARRPQRRRGRRGGRRNRPGGASGTRGPRDGGEGGEGGEGGDAPQGDL